MPPTRKGLTMAGQHSKALNDVSSAVGKFGEKLNELCVRLENVEGDVKSMLGVVRDNGQTALMQQVPLLDARVANLEAKSNNRDQRSWQLLVVVIAAVLGSGFVGALLSRVYSTPAPVVKVDLPESMLKGASPSTHR